MGSFLAGPQRSHLYVPDILMTRDQVISYCTGFFFGLAAGILAGWAIFS
jgi:hypothetical protein